MVDSFLIVLTFPLESASRYKQELSSLMHCLVLLVDQQSAFLFYKTKTRREQFVILFLLHLLSHPGTLFV